MPFDLRESTYHNYVDAQKRDQFDLQELSRKMFKDRSKRPQRLQKTLSQSPRETRKPVLKCYDYLSENITTFEALEPFVNFIERNLGVDYGLNCSSREFFQRSTHIPHCATKAAEYP